MGMNIAVLPFVAAILAVTRLPELPPIEPLLLGLPVSVFGLSCSRARPFSAFYLGLLYVSMNAVAGLNAVFPDDLQGKDLQVIGQVSGLPGRSDGILHFSFNVEEITDCASRWTGTVNISWYRAPVEVQPGDRLQLTVRLSKPGSTLNPGLFDYEGWLFSRGIQAGGYVRSNSKNELLESDSIAFPHHVLRYRIRQTMLGLLKESPVKGLLIALTIGETGQISKPAWHSLTRTGTNHLLIISGLHVGLVAAMIFKLLGLTPLSIRWVGVTTMIVTAFYALIAGFGLPVQRALIMTSAVLLAVSISRRVSTLTMFSASLLGVVMVQPFAVMSNGFWLSFGAVFSLIYAYNGKLMGNEGTGMLKVLLAAIRTQWVVSVAMFPLLLYLLSQASLVTFTVNLVAIPWISFLVIPWLLIFVAALPISTDISAASLSIGEFFLSIIWQYLEWVADKELMFYGSEGLVPLLIALFGVLIVFSPKGTVPRWLGWMCFLPLLVVHEVPGRGELRVTFVDVGQGLSVILQTRRTTLLYDTGPKFGDRFDSGEQILTPLLRKYGLRKLDAFIVSHGDNDHAGGMNSILRNFDIDRFVSSVSERAQPCDSPINWSADGVRFEIFRLQVGGGNNSSCLLLAHTTKFGVLITGDIEEVAEGLLHEKILPEIQVISVPHHGSKTSSSPGFINHLMPSLAIVSAGFRNRFSHPEQAVLKRYEKRHVRVLNTADEGAIRIWLGENGIQRVERTRLEGRRFWHR